MSKYYPPDEARMEIAADLAMSSYLHAVAALSPHSNCVVLIVSRPLWEVAAEIAKELASAPGQTPPWVNCLPDGMAANSWAWSVSDGLRTVWSAPAR